MTTDKQYKLPPILLKRFEQFKKIDNNTKRFERIIELGKKLPPFDAALKTEESKAQGCVSLTYVTGTKQNGLMQYIGDSSSHLVKGLLAVLIEGLSGQSPESILAIDPKFLEDMGISQTLTASRANGFMNTYQMMINIAKRNINDQ